jgi:hypothetical protein
MIVAHSPTLPLINNNEPISITVGILSTVGVIITIYGTARAITTYIRLQKVKKDMKKIINPLNNPIKMIIRVPISPKPTCDEMNG